jgi:hypothetical protein
VTLTAACGTGKLWSVRRLEVCDVVAACRVVGVTKGAVRTTRYRTPRVSNRGSITRSVLVTRVRTAGTQTARRKIKLTRVLGRDRSTADLNGTVNNCRGRTRDKVCIGRVVRMTSRTIDRQSERVRGRVVRTVTACQWWITVTERTVTRRTRIPVSQCPGIRWIVAVRR